MIKLSSKVYFSVPFILMFTSSIIFMNYYIAESSLPTFNGPFIEDDNFTSSDTVGNFNITLNFTQTDFYKGGNINFTAELTVALSSAYFKNLTVEVFDPINVLSANQSLSIEQTFEPGVYQLDFTLGPGYHDGGFLALIDKDYTFTEYYAFYHQSQKDSIVNEPIDHNVTGHLVPAYEQTKDKEWNILEQTDVNLIKTGSTMNVESLSTFSSFTFQLEVETTGYYELSYEITGLDKSDLVIQFGSFNLDITLATSLGSIPIGTMDGKYNLTVIGDIVSLENLTITLNMTTHYLPIYIAIANNNWDANEGDSDKFESPASYIRVVSERLERIMNITLIPVIEFDFRVGLLVNELPFMRNLAENAAGVALNLKSDSWHEIPGTSASNNGADILMIFTNRTMDHLGVVNKNDDFENVNVVMMAQGSRHFQGVDPDDVEMRINPLWADNLIQHEISHALRAPDRWTHEDPPSVMTKSAPEYAYGDFIQGDFWLELVNWLEEDIQTMMSFQDIFRR